MPSAARIALALVLLSGVADGEEFRVVAELGRVGPPGELSIRTLARGAAPSLVSVSPGFVNVWPLGRVAEPVVSVLSGVAAFGSNWTFGDFDGDGRLDLALTVDNGITLYRGEGDGRFMSAGSIVLAQRPYLLAAADFDGDGRTDLASVQADGSNVISCFLSTGGFTFAPARNTPVTTYGGAFSLAAGDVDGDGRPDVVVSPWKGGVTIWKGGGDGTFALSDQFLDGYYPARVQIADLDGDGRPELVYRNPDSYGYLVPVDVYRNDGSGRFHLWSNPRMTRGGSDSFVADFDGDGLPDVGFVDVDQSNGETYLSWYRASGGTLVEGRMTVPPGSRVTAAGDWDGDGRAELLVSGAGGVQVLGRSGARTDVAVVPVLLATTGLLGARFDSDLLVTNSGSSAAHVTFRYTAAAGGGSGAVERNLAPGLQIYAPSAVGFLRDAGLAIATDGNVVGTLRIETAGASSPRAVSVSVRTTTPAGAGVAYGGAPNVALLRGSAVVPWLVETAKDRTNLALVNAGAAPDGPVTLRVEVHAADGSAPPVVLPDVVLEPGAFQQIGRVLASAGLSASAGWARVSRVSGEAPYLAWAAVNDGGSGDGSFEPALPEDVSFSGPWVVPNAVRTSRYVTELVATNPGSKPVTLQITLVTTGTLFEQTIPAGATFYVPDFFAEVLRRGLPGAPAADSDFASPLYLKDPAGGGRVFAGIRVTSTPAAGRSFGVFEAAAPADLLAAFSFVVPDLRQDARTRTNLGLVNLYPFRRTFHLEIVDGETGRVAGMADFPLEGNEFRQFNAILRSLAPGTARAFARITPVLAPGGFAALPVAAFAVVNDGPEPGQGTDDGSFVPAVAE